MPVLPSFTKQLWTITSNTDVYDNKYKSKWGQQETPNLHCQLPSTPAQHSSLHWTSYHTPARWHEKLRQSHCRKSDRVPQMNQYCLMSTTLLDWKSCFALLQTTTNYLIRSIRCCIACNLLENRLYCVISTILKINQLSAHYQQNNHCKNSHLEQRMRSVWKSYWIPLPQLPFPYLFQVFCNINLHSSFPFTSAFWTAGILRDGSEADRKLQLTKSLPLNNSATELYSESRGRIITVSPTIFSFQMHDVKKSAFL